MPETVIPTQTRREKESASESCGSVSEGDDKEGLLVMRQHDSPIGTEIREPLTQAAKRRKKNEGVVMVGFGRAPLQL